MSQRQKIAALGKWVHLIGYSRAIRAGSHVFVAGTTSTDEKGEVVAPGDPYAQTVQTLKNIERALIQAGARLADVVRTRMFVTDISRWEEYARGHHEFFHDVLPVSAMVEITRLGHPDLMIEIEADAVIED